VMVEAQDADLAMSLAKSIADLVSIT